MDATLEQREQLERLADRTAVADLVSRLGRILDEGRFDEMPELLAEDVRVRTPGGEVVGRDAAVAQAARNHRPEQPIQHLFTDLVVDPVADDRATARANLVVYFGTAEGEAGGRTAGSAWAPPVEYSMGAVYDLGLVRTDDGHGHGHWRFDRIDSTPVWTTGTRPRPVG